MEDKEQPDQHPSHERVKGYTGMPHASGLYTWLLDQVQARFGEVGKQLVANCYAYGDQRYDWLLGEIVSAFGRSGTALQQEFHERRKAIVARARLREKIRSLELSQQLRALALERNDTNSAARHQRAIEKATSYIQSRIAQGVSAPAHITIPAVVPADILVEEQRYHTALPLAVKEWYHYSRLHGHCILCALSSLYLEDPTPAHSMRSVPVRTVLRELRSGALQVSDEGFVLVDLPVQQDPWYPREDRELAAAEEKEQAVLVNGASHNLQ